MCVIDGWSAGRDGLGGLGRAGIWRDTAPGDLGLRLALFGVRASRRDSAVAILTL